jgi:hypothetical protein
MRDHASSGVWRRVRTQGSVDVWSAGVQLFIVASGVLPFYAETEPEYREIILAAEENLEFHDADWHGASAERK